MKQAVKKPYVSCDTVWLAHSSTICAFVLARKHEARAGIQMLLAFGLQARAICFSQLPPFPVTSIKPSLPLELLFPALPPAQSLAAW